MRDITEDQVDRSVHANDDMYNNHEKDYFRVGREALTIVRRALEAEGKKIEDPSRILDLPCGFGRVLRYLRAALPNAEIHACDLQFDGVDYCAKQFGAIPVYSHVDPFQVPFPRDYFDLIFVGSLFTHLEEPRWTTFLTFFRSLLRPGGTLVFSTMGRQAYKRIGAHWPVYQLTEEQFLSLHSQYETNGFGYVNYSGTETYGVSLAEPAWVCRLLTSLPEFRLISFGEKAWDNHHDVFACVRDVGWQARCTPAPDFRRRERQVVLLPTKKSSGLKSWWRRSA